jgi:predicted signal transduction protein with EAL and GGDEF domain
MNDMRHPSSDISNQADPAKTIFQELSLYKMIVNASLDSITLIDRQYTYRIVTDAYLSARNLKKDQIINHTVADVWGKEIFEQIIKDKLDKCFRGKSVSYRSSFEFKKNETNYIETIFTPCFTSNSEVSYAAVISRNMTELKESQEKIAFLAYYDSLTNLPSRPLFLELLNREINNAKRTGRSVAVFFFDLDEFKKINDTFGHSAGDKLLVSVGMRLKKYLRQGDLIGRVSETKATEHSDKQNFLARIGGDEFTFIIPDISEKKITTAIAERILDLFKKPFQVIDREVFISTSIGIALYPDDGDNVETLLKHADTAMYKAKEVGKNTFRYFSSRMNEKAKARIKLENKLRSAICNQDFQLYYQPQYNVETAQMVGMEALIRWEDNEMGFVPPTELIALAEETGMIIDIGDWAIHTACRQGKIWHESGFENLHMAVNLSVKQFFDLTLVQKIKSAIATTKFNPALLELEITESAMMHDTDRALLILQELKDVGVKISLDDFGTGYSSLIHLKLFHIDKLKIDQVFIRNANLEGRDGAIISAIIDMCHKLKIEAVAEGVETQKSLTFLKERKCHLAQGFIFSPPLPPEAIEPLLKK